ncbi:hypothetical protein [Candidatus Poriferisocius sp.]|uniref:hypothetical protein n=1 Tax=Candidatus Poriferisocius sp. TaxID=3101276 RepID=UPI003B51D0E8
MPLTWAVTVTVAPPESSATVVGLVERVMPVGGSSSSVTVAVTGSMVRLVG